MLQAITSLESFLLLDEPRRLHEKRLLYLRLPRHPNFLTSLLLGVICILAVEACDDFSIFSTRLRYAFSLAAAVFLQ